MGQKKKLSLADFEYTIVGKDNAKILLIIDLDLGNRSVTNDIVNVLGDIAAAENKELPELIAYRDSMGRWDGWDPIQGRFYPLAEKVQAQIRESTKHKN